MSSKRSASATVKVFLIAVNFLFLLCGIGFLGVGVYLSTGGSMADYIRAFDLDELLQLLQPIRVVLIACGCVTVLVSLCGCFGACRESRCLVVLYLVFLLLILIANAAVAVMVLVFKARPHRQVSGAIQASIRRHYGNASSSAGKAVTKFVDGMQMDEDCCGWSETGSSENIFLDTPWYRQQLLRVQAGGTDNIVRFPDSCCNTDLTPNSTDPYFREKYHQCVTAKNMTVAQNDGLIRTGNCLARIFALKGMAGFVVNYSILVTIILQVICIAVSALFLRQISKSEGDRAVSV